MNRENVFYPIYRNIKPKGATDHITLKKKHGKPLGKLHIADRKSKLLAYSSVLEFCLYSTVRHKVQNLFTPTPETDIPVISGHLLMCYVPGY